MYNTQKQVSDERYSIITKRYAKFQESMSNATLEPVKVFDPLNQRQIDELDLIREVSRDLQKKKEEDVKKAALLQQEAEKTEIEEPPVDSAEKTDA